LKDICLELVQDHSISVSEGTYLESIPDQGISNVIYLKSVTDQGISESNLLELAPDQSISKVDQRILKTACMKSTLGQPFLRASEKLTISVEVHSKYSKSQSLLRLPKRPARHCKIITDDDLVIDWCYSQDKNRP